MEDGTTALITRLASHRCGGSVILFPTAETTVLPLSGNTDRGPVLKRRRQMDADGSQKDDIFSTQGTTQALVSSPRSSSYSEEVISVESQLFKISINEFGRCVTDRRRAESPPSSPIDRLIRCDDRERIVYRSASIALDPDAVPPGCTSVTACSDVVRTLCGSCSASDLAIRPLSLPSSKTEILRRHVCDMLWGMVHECIVFRWILRRRNDGGGWDVSEVMLPEI